MLKELKKYENLGTPNFFWELVKLLKTENVWRPSEVKSHFYNTTIDGRKVFDGCIPILELCGIISIKEGTEELVLNYKFRNLYSERMCQGKLLEGFLQKLADDEEFQHIFKQSHYDYIQHKAIIVEGAAFGFRYSNVRRLLTDFGFLKPHPQFEEKLIVSSKWKKLVDQKITPNVRRLMGIDALKEKIEQQELNGESAEKYVLEFERKRLDAKVGVEWIAPYDTSAGFDVLSFHIKENSEANRFIEVKSYAGKTPYFYWTKNEMRVAGERKDDYLIYLVNRDEMNNEDYEPEMIADPIKNILEDDSWDKLVDKYYLSKNE